MATPSTSPSAPDPAGVPRTLRLLVAMFAGALVVLTLLTLLIVSPPEDEAPLWVLLASVVPVALGGLLAQAFGFRVTPLAATDAPESWASPSRTALMRLQTSTMVRLALTEAPLLLLFAATIVLPFGPWPLVVALAPGLAVMLLMAWPSRRNVGVVADRLEADGVRSGLREMFGHA